MRWWKSFFRRTSLLPFFLLVLVLLKVNYTGLYYQRWENSLFDSSSRLCTAGWINNLCMLGNHFLSLFPCSTCCCYVSVQTEFCSHIFISFAICMTCLCHTTAPISQYNVSFLLVLCPLLFLFFLQVEAKFNWAQYHFLLWATC